jgi:hypothetical protein
LGNARTDVPPSVASGNLPIVLEALGSGDKGDQVVENVTGGSPSGGGDRLPDAGGSLSSMANTPNHDILLDRVDISLPDIPLEPVNANFKLDSEPTPSKQNPDSEIATEPKAIDIPGTDKSPTPDPLVRSSTPPTLLSAKLETIPVNPTDQSAILDIALEGDLPVPLSANSDEPDPQPIVTTLHQPSPHLPPNLTVTVNISTNSSPPCTPPATLITITSESLLSLPTPGNKSKESSLPKHLLVELTNVRHRYGDLQCAFHDCHLALQDLKLNLKSSPPSTPSMSFLPPHLI